MTFGVQKENERFKKAFPVFLKYHDVLEATADKFFEREIKGASKADRVIFGLGIICAEDFQQAFILCSNGFGIGGLQIVRGMYERLVTAAYLSKFPDEVEDFIDYHYVHRRKGLTHLKNMFGSDGLARIIPVEQQAEIEASFQAVKEKFTETLCKTCNKTRTMFSWSKHHIGVLAEKGEHGLAANYYTNYYRPTLMSHSTVSSLVSRLVEDDDGTLAFAVDGQRDAVTEALVAAHTLLISVFALQDKHFKLGLDDEIHQRFKEYEECWNHLKRVD